jgi:hypothetical protein
MRKVVDGYGPAPHGVDKLSPQIIRCCCAACMSVACKFDDVCLTPSLSFPCALFLNSSRLMRSLWGVRLCP